MVSGVLHAAHEAADQRWDGRWDFGQFLESFSSGKQQPWAFWTSQHACQGTQQQTCLLWNVEPRNRLGSRSWRLATPSAVGAWENWCLIMSRCICQSVSTKSAFYRNLRILAKTDTLRNWRMQCKAARVFEMPCLQLHQYDAFFAEAGATIPREMSCTQRCLFWVLLFFFGGSPSTRRSRTAEAVGMKPSVLCGYGERSVPPRRQLQVRLLRWIIWGIWSVRPSHNAWCSRPFET